MRSRRNGLKRLRLLLALMPLLAGAYEAYAAASRVADNAFLTWLVSFLDELATRLPLMLILALVVFGIVTMIGALLSRLEGASFTAQAARNPSEIPLSPKPVKAPIFLRKNEVRHHRY
jgi:hypothetical protein